MHPRDHMSTAVEYNWAPAWSAQVQVHHTTSLKIFLSWSVSLVPENRTLFVRSSAIKQPIDHMSTAVEYNWAPAWSAQVQVERLAGTKNDLATQPLHVRARTHTHTQEHAHIHIATLVCEELCHQTAD
jgi:hypothetical protein